MKKLPGIERVKKREGTDLRDLPGWLSEDDGVEVLAFDAANDLLDESLGIQDKLVDKFRTGDRKNALLKIDGYIAAELKELEGLETYDSLLTFFKKYQSALRRRIRTRRNYEFFDRKVNVLLHPEVIENLSNSYLQYWRDALIIDNTLLRQSISNILREGEVGTDNEQTEEPEEVFSKSELRATTNVREMIPFYQSYLRSEIKKTKSYLDYAISKRDVLKFQAARNRIAEYEENLEDTVLGMFGELSLEEGKLASTVREWKEEQLK